MFKIIIIIAALIMFFNGSNNTGPSIKDEVWTTGASLEIGEGKNDSKGTVTGNSIVSSLIEENTHWYNSPEEAIDDKSLLSYPDAYTDHKDLMDNILYQSERGDVIDIFFKVPSEEIKSDVGVIRLRHENGKYSTACGQDFVIFEQDEWVYVYDILDHTAEALINEYIVQDSLMKRGGDHIWYGGCEDIDELQRVRIAGKPIENITPINCKDGKTRYFWYFDGEGLTEKLKSIGVSGYTYREIEEAIPLTLEGE